MKKYRFLPLTLIAVFALFITACSDDNGTNNNGDNAADYYKMSVNNYWVYQVDATDKNNNVTPGTTTYDSTVIVASLAYYGKTAYKTLSFMSDGAKDTSYFSIDGSKLYTYTTNLGNNQFSVPYGGWILLADINGTTWTIIDTNVSVPIEIQQNVNATLNAQVKLTGAKNPKENLMINSTSTECYVFTQTATIKGNLDLGLSQVTIDQSIPIKYYFGKKTGLVKVTQGSSTINLPLIGEWTIPGFIQTVLRFNVN